MSKNWTVFSGVDPQIAFIPATTMMRAPMARIAASAQVHLGRRLADYALEQDGDPDEARRARGEADFLTSRAVKLAPDSEEVKKLRDEVVKLLKLKTD